MKLSLSVYFKVLLSNKSKDFYQVMGNLKHLILFYINTMSEVGFLYVRYNYFKKGGLYQPQITYYARLYIVIHQMTIEMLCYNY